MFGLFVMEGMTLSGHLSNINEILKLEKMRNSATATVFKSEKMETCTRKVPKTTVSLDTYAFVHMYWSVNGSSKSIENAKSDLN